MSPRTCRADGWSSHRAAGHLLPASAAGDFLCICLQLPFCRRIKPTCHAACSVAGIVPMRSVAMTGYLFVILV